MSDQWRPAYARRDVQIEIDETAFDGFFKIKRLTLEHPRFDGSRIQITRELFHRGDAVCVLLHDPKRHEVVLVEQFRVGALAAESPWMLELVAGMVEPNETAQDVAIREVKEEAGLDITQAESIFRYLPSGGGCDEWIDILYAQIDASNASGVFGLEEEGEDIKVHCLAADRAFELVRSGAISSSPAIIGLQWLELNQDRLRV